MIGQRVFGVNNIVFDEWTKAKAKNSKLRVLHPKDKICTFLVISPQLKMPRWHSS